jgi:hypothetical protein
MQEDKLAWLYARHKPAPELIGHITSNWPDMGEPVKKALPLPCWFIDVEGFTVGKAKELEAAMAILDHFPGGCLRYHEPTEETLHKEVEDRRERYRQGIK